MTARVLRPVITFTTVTAVLLAALAVYAFFTASTSRADSVYFPVTTSKYCNAMSATFPDTDVAGSPGCTENTTTSAAADFYTTLAMTATELNFATVVTFAPVGTVITDGDSMPEGAKMGGLSSTTTLGTANGPCTSTVPVDFVFYNVDLPDNSADPRASGNIWWPQDEGSPDRFGYGNGGQDGDHTGTEPWANSPTNPGPDVGVSVGTPPRATETSVGITNYPIHLLDLFDPDFVPGNPPSGGGPAGTDPIIPKAVYGGLSNVVGTWQMLYFAQFDATGVNSMAGLPSPFTLMDPDMGAPSVSVLNDTTVISAAPSTINDFCTPLSVNTVLLGNPVCPTCGSSGTVIRATNPSTAGTGFVMQYNASLRDTDQDGWENPLDPCQTVLQAGPRVNGAGWADADADGIPDGSVVGGAGSGGTCDPDDTTPVLDPNQSDTDADTFSNRQDNCTLTSNIVQTESEATGASPADDGPRTDGIGDACDSESGTITVVQNRSSGSATVSITLSDTVQNGRYHVQTNHVPKCFAVGAPVDVDGDGYCAAQDGGGESGGCAGTTPPSCTVRHGAWAGAHPMLQADSDSDTFSDAFETYMGTDGTKSCAMTPIPPATAGGVNDEILDNWPMDFNDDRAATIIDVSTYGSRFGKAVNAAGVTTRHDLTGDGSIAITDVSKFGAVFGKRCGGDVGMPGPFVQQ